MKKSFCATVITGDLGPSVEVKDVKVFHESVLFPEGISYLVLSGHPEFYTTGPMCIKPFKNDLQHFLSNPLPSVIIMNGQVYDFSVFGVCENGRMVPDGGYGETNNLFPVDECH